MVTITAWGLPLVALGALGLFAMVQSVRQDEHSLPLAIFVGPPCVLLILIGVGMTFPETLHFMFA